MVIRLNVPEFNINDYFAEGLGRSYRGRTFTGIREQFCPDALAPATNDSCGYQQELNPGLLGASPSP